MPECGISVIQCLLYCILRKKLEIREVERQYEHGGFVTK